jgi:hypothetical protein
MAFDCMYPHDTKHQYVVSSGGSRPDGEEVGRRSGLAKSFALFRGRKSDQKGTLEKDHPRLSEAVGTATKGKCRQSMLWLLQIRGVSGQRYAVLHPWCARNMGPGPIWCLQQDVLATTGFQEVLL